MEYVLMFFYQLLAVPVETFTTAHECNLTAAYLVNHFYEPGAKVFAWCEAVTKI